MDCSAPLLDPVVSLILCRRDNGRGILARAGRVQSSPLSKMPKRPKMPKRSKRANIGLGCAINQETDQPLLHNRYKRLHPPQEPPPVQLAKCSSEAEETGPDRRHVAMSTRATRLNPTAKGGRKEGRGERGMETTPHFSC